MPQMLLVEPLINGVRFDFSSIELNIAGPVGTVRPNIKSISYRDERKPGYQRGNRAQRVGRTMGEYECSGDLELSKLDFENLISLLTSGGLGYLEQEFHATINYAARGSPIVTDVLAGCLLLKPEDSHSEGPDLATVKCSLDIMYIIRNGHTPLSMLLK